MARRTQSGTILSLLTDLAKKACYIAGEHAHNPPKTEPCSPHSIGFRATPPLQHKASRIQTELGGEGEMRRARTGKASADDVAAY